MSEIEGSAVPANISPGSRASRRRFLQLSALAGAGAALAAPGAAAASAPAGQKAGQSKPPVNGRGTNATYYNDAQFNAADPFVLHDVSGYYYAYSTDGATTVDGRSYLFAVYRSPDLVTWEQLPGGAIPADEPNRWGRDWFWAPAVYHNRSTGKYFMFYAARQRDNVERDFGYASFEEPCKVGVAVADSPAGPFSSIANHPIDYFPYDPDYHDVNLIMDATQLKPPATLAEGLTAPLGTYIPFIDPDVFFDEDGRIYLYFSRNAYRNWVWDTELGKYIEESNIYAVELTRDWWNDPTGSTLPSIAPAYRDANKRVDAPPGARRDGYAPILSYGADPQAWENAHVNDYTLYHGTRKDRRWEEGSTTFVRHVRDGRGKPVRVYYLLYSANNWENEYYGVGYATSSGPLGPFTKYAGNPILSEDLSLPISGTGHGSLAFSPDGQESYYVHHGRPADGPRKLYTSRLLMDGAGVDAHGVPALSTVESVSDEPVPSGVAPYRLTTSAGKVVVSVGQSAPATWTVQSANRVPMPLANPLNRVVVGVDRPDVVAVAADGASSATLTGLRPGTAVVTLAYQRRLASGQYVDVVNRRGAHSEPVTQVVRVVVTNRPA
ncbi:glycoside hydrolase family 43 protein [Rugosimonospora africana]|uniref:Uncharacterized protein n=1 Tax=Rugosimonospora africana TaxID=556532 RepID=A0A8J3VQN3_9ACTN|nr:glycoside hydrolase family 43 protein [Rugosimonospora africana]GIH15222.1 hypothetical protein Raf01_33940 [Rugosimonospora africana]